MCDSEDLSMTDQPCNCADCAQDPSMTCSYTGQDVSVSVVYIANAYRGNLILCPGGANGQIGGLLHQLTPPQHYSHMGIMVADFDLIRHTTASAQRLTADEYFTGNILGVSAPVDGLNPDHLQFGGLGRLLNRRSRSFLPTGMALGLLPRASANLITDQIWLIKRVPLEGLSQSQRCRSMVSSTAPIFSLPWSLSLALFWKHRRSRRRCRVLLMRRQRFTHTTGSSATRMGSSAVCPTTLARRPNYPTPFRTGTHQHRNGRIGATRHRSSRCEPQPCWGSARLLSGRQ